MSCFYVCMCHKWSLQSSIRNHNIMNHTIYLAQYSACKNLETHNICSQALPAGHPELVQVAMESPSGAPWQIESWKGCDQNPKKHRGLKLDCPQKIPKRITTDSSLLRAQPFLRISLNFMLNGIEYMGVPYGPVYWPPCRHHSASPP